MKSARRGALIAGAIAAIGIASGVYAVGASADALTVPCSLDGQNFSCVLPASTVTVTQDPVTSTVTSTADPVTVTASGSTVTSTAFATVTVTKTTAKGTVTVTAAPSSTVAPATSTQPVTTPSSATSTPTTVSTTPISSGGFPDATNTGVPAGIALTPYTGPMTIKTAGTVIDSKLITGTLLTQAANVTIKNSKIVGTVDNEAPNTLSIIDSEVDGGQSDVAAVTQDDVTLLRANIHGARQSITCGDNCSITDSWLHGQYNKPGGAWHVNGYISNGGNNVVIRHNTLACDAKYDAPSDGGCTGPAAIFADFDPVYNVTFDRNLFVAGPGAYCLYAGDDPGKSYAGNAKNATGIVITNNVFQRGSNKKCATYGAVTSYKSSGAGNVFTGNVWDDNTPVQP